MIIGLLQYNLKLKLCLTKTNLRNVCFHHYLFKILSANCYLWIFFQKAQKENAKIIDSNMRSYWWNLLALKPNESSKIKVNIGFKASITVP